MNSEALRRTLALAAILAIVVVFTLESIPHREPRGADDGRCPACQAAREHVGDAPGSAGILNRPPEPVRPDAAEPAIEGSFGVEDVPSVSPRSPPAAFA